MYKKSLFNDEFADLSSLEDLSSSSSMDLSLYGSTESNLELDYPDLYNENELTSSENMTLCDNYPVEFLFYYVTDNFEKHQLDHVYEYTSFFDMK